MGAKTELTLGEKIDRAKEGRSQTWLVKQMNTMGCSITEAQFSRKKKQVIGFTPQELAALSEVLNIKL